MDARERRMAQNETLFREVNERVHAVAGRLGSDEHVYEYLCECSNADCTFRLPLTQETYERVRSDPAQFVILPEHAVPEIEVVVEAAEDYWIVRKVGEAAEFVEHMDPRTR
jgi:hypothetical protein